MSRAGALAAVYAAMRTAHDVGDHVLQTDTQAAGKAHADPDVWVPAMAGHVAGYHAAQLAAVLTTNRQLRLRLRPGRVALAVAWSAGTHALLDRRWPVDRILARTGHPSTDPGAWRSGTFRVDLQPLAAALAEAFTLADQALFSAINNPSGTGSFIGGAVSAGWDDVTAFVTSLDD